MTSFFWLILLAVLAYGLVHSLLASLIIKTKWNLLALNIGLTVYILVGINFEERKLQLELGEQYAEYHYLTPMLIPGLVFPRSGHKS